MQSFPYTFKQTQSQKMTQKLYYLSRNCIQWHACRHLGYNQKYFDGYSAMGLFNCNKYMQSTLDFQNTKNRRRLIIQNIKLYQQVKQIEAQVTIIADNMQPQDSVADNSYQPILQEIALQERIIKQLKAKIEAFRLERAKDNVEYIIHEEDDLKIAKKLWTQLIDEKEVLTRRKDDKSNKLQNNLPYQHYQQKFLSGLMEVVHHNREQAAKITEIEREIRKYHLMVKNGKSSTPKNIATPEDIAKLDKDIYDKVEQRKQLEKQWKPHFQRLDQQYAKLLRQLANKKETLAEVEREERSWSTRMLTIRDAEDVISNKKRVSQVVVNPKLKQQLEDYLINEEEKKKKKVNNEELKYQFKSNQKEEQEAKEKEKKTQIPPPVTTIKKKQDRIVQTMHDDKNISKKIEKGGNAAAKKHGKVDQMHNTELSLPVSSNKTALKDGESPVHSAKKKMPNEEKVSSRHWEHNPESNKKQGKINPKDTKNAVLKMKEVSISTDGHFWKSEET